MARKSRRKVETRPPVPNGVIFLFLGLLTLVVFAQVTTHSFLNYDDGQFVTENAHVSSGLTADSIGWAIGSTSIGWYPLTWLSHMLDVDLWRQQAGMHVLTSVLLHFASACLLFLALQRMTLATWPSAFVAAIFAIHPAHVESVAWVSERKDTLSTFFAMLAIFFYASAPARRWRVFVAMALSLMAKQMYITLPFVLLLLDFWPLARRGIRSLVIEKLPLFALTIFGAVMAVVGQRNLTALQSVENGSARGPPQQRRGRVCALPRKILRARKPSGPLYPMEPISSAAAIGAVILAARDLDRGVLLPQRVSVSLHRLVLVPGNAGAGNRDRADRHSGNCGPLHIFLIHRAVDHRDVGRPETRADRGRNDRDRRIRSDRIPPGRLLEGQRDAFRAYDRGHSA